MLFAPTFPTFHIPDVGLLTPFAFASLITGFVAVVGGVALDCDGGALAAVSTLWLHPMVCSD